uniref:Uncharacterized protein n=1 Tax=Setaria viridis TaxID=4556 RepID=A0A4U6T697_SETVI|nr:hypothetical protein SEVIR_9G373800v2 [Setaria viridis]
MPSPGTATPPFCLFPALSFCKNPALDDDCSSSLEFGSAVKIFLQSEGQGKCKALFRRSFYGEGMFVVAGASLVPAKVDVGFSIRFACEKYGPVKKKKNGLDSMHKHRVL